MPKSTFIRAAILALALLTPPAFVQSDYPNKPLRIVVGFPPGQATDVIARMLGEKLATAIGQPVAIDNKPGKAGSIGAATNSTTPAQCIGSQRGQSPGSTCEHGHVHARLPWLSAYLGHQKVLGTEAYLKATPQLLALTRTRFEEHLRCACRPR